ncbi:MAG: beta-lactamase family protein [Dysgonamonadaceae bacterium]|nr:beta-lactamase family protein [Dysgonamonadaceae bacterium]
MSNSCTAYRIARYGAPGIYEYPAFPQEKIDAGDDKFYFFHRKDTIDTSRKNISIPANEHLSMDDFLKKSKTTAFLIIRNDTILYEKYDHPGYRDKISTFFSVTKSITSLLVGIAVDEGYIKNVNDPVTEYITELKTCDPLFQKLTIEHLLNMQAGLRFNESYTNPFGSMAKLFYGTNQTAFIKKLKFDKKPGEEYNYNSVTTAILGMVLERAVGRSYAEYLEAKVWKPLGMEYGASVSLDDAKNRSAKTYQGINATAIDLAKIGRLYLNGGNWNGKQIVSKEWIERSIMPCPEEDHLGKNYYGYQYQWYSNKDSYGFYPDSIGRYRFNDSISAVRFAEQSAFKYWNIRKYANRDNSGYHWAVFAYLPQFYAEGILGQILEVDTERKIIIVRLGRKNWSGRYNPMWLAGRLVRNSPIVEKKW